MSCNSCAKNFSLLRQEKGCPGCGFSYCSKCLTKKIYLPKLNSEVKVCSKCERASKENKKENQIVLPPDAYFKRLAATENMSKSSGANEATSIDDQIQARLQKLKENNTSKVTSEEEIATRLQGIKSQVPSTSDADIQNRLAKLRGMPVIDNKPILPVRDLRTEQEQADDLIKQYVEQTQIDTKYQNEFDGLLGDIESRMQKLKETNSSTVRGTDISEAPRNENNALSELAESDEEESVRKIVEKIKAEAVMDENTMSPSIHDELPFCEICNEDATLRCLGCKYLFCKQCFLDHKDDDDDCNKYEPYQPPKES